MAIWWKKEKEQLEVTENTFKSKFCSNTPLKYRKSSNFTSSTILTIKSSAHAKFKSEDLSLDLRINAVTPNRMIFTFLYQHNDTF